MITYGRKRRHKGTDAEKQLACELRVKQGLSINNIASLLSRSVETVRQWTIDVILTEKQINKLKANKRRFLK